MSERSSPDIVERLRDDTRSAVHCSLSEEAANEIERLQTENWQLKQACGYPIPADKETPQNPFKCGICDARSSAGTAASLTERLIDAAVDYERSEGRQGKEARQELSKARAAVEAAITNAAQPSRPPVDNPLKAYTVEQLEYEIAMRAAVSYPDRHCEFCHVPMPAADCCDSEFESKGCPHTRPHRATGD